MNIKLASSFGCPGRGGCHHPPTTSPGAVAHNSFAERNVSVVVVSTTVCTEAGNLKTRDDGHAAVVPAGTFCADRRDEIKIYCDVCLLHAAAP